jgi:hypothetical protein
MRRLLILLILLVATPVAAQTRGRVLHAFVTDDTGAITIVISDGTPPTTAQWSVEEMIGNVETMEGGTFAPHDLVLAFHGASFAAGGYRMACDVTTFSTRDTETDSAQSEVKSFDHVTPTIHVTHHTRMVTLNTLMCTLTTPTGRTLTGSGGYEKTVTRDTGP